MPADRFSADLASDAAFKSALVECSMSVACSHLVDGAHQTGVGV